MLRILIDSFPHYYAMSTIGIRLNVSQGEVIKATQVARGKARMQNFEL